MSDELRRKIAGIGIGIAYVTLLLWFFSVLVAIFAIQGTWALELSMVLLFISVTGYVVAKCMDPTVG